MDGSASLAVKRLKELALRAGHTGRVQFTRFLEPPVLSEARAVAGACGVGCAFFGGYTEAERVMAAFYADSAPEPGAFPIAALRLTWQEKFAHPAHRDLLGAAMGLGLEREAMGDIAMGVHRGAPCAYLFAVEDVADYIAANLDSAGRASLKAEITADNPEIAPPEGAQVRVTVQSSRLDAVLAAGCNLSRSEAQRLVAAGLVKLNHAPCLRADARLEPGDLISARGQGRLKVLEALGKSRRGRLALSLFRYRRT